MNHRSTATTSERPWLPFRAQTLGMMEILLLAAAATSLLAAALAFPSEFLRAAPECPIHRWTSFHCAACGTTRAIIALLGGDWMAAMRYNLLFTWLTAISIPALSIASFRWFRGKRLALPVSLRSFAIPLLGVAILFMIARNLPFAPWNQLAP